MLKTFLTASLVAIGTIATPIHALTFMGDLSASDPTYNRPSAGTPPTTLSGFGTAASYDVYNFNVDLTGSYTLQTLSASLDTSIILYENSFIPTSPLTNALVADDDSGSGTLSLITRNLTASTNYFLVVTSFANGQFGNYTGSITGAGNATLVTPVPFEFSPVLGLGVLGGLFATKKLIQKYAKK